MIVTDDDRGPDPATPEKWPPMIPAAIPAISSVSSEPQTSAQAAARHLQQGLILAESRSRRIWSEVHIDAP